MNILGQGAAACLGTVGFAVLFGVPRRYYLRCALIGAMGWVLYVALQKWLSQPEATFAATLAVVLLSRFFAVRAKCPVTVFLISGIFPLVPGAGVYWTVYYIVMDQLDLAGEKGLWTLKIAVAIVLGIVLMLELPQKWFAGRSKVPSPREP